ncbi:uncharacterized protein LOC131329117 [Rhododendron vialii]|uniref:uncharacterized protein LOC131329117 n=1 Tax=Rhododendron vialii TaxID=182163 RepID=UPI00265F543E|nr:uncharacterized protein LOC131329117 [Rhododendron vialii]
MGGGSCPFDACNGEGISQDRKRHSSAIEVSVGDSSLGVCTDEASEDGKHFYHSCRSSETEERFTTSGERAESVDRKAARFKIKLRERPTQSRPAEKRRKGALTTRTVESESKEEEEEEEEEEERSPFSSGSDDSADDPKDKMDLRERDDNDDAEDFDN